MPTPTFSAKKDAQPEMDGRFQAMSGGDKFREWVEEDDKINQVWRGEADWCSEECPFDEPNEEACRWCIDKCRKRYIKDAYAKCEEGLGRHEEGKPILQIIASYQSQCQEYINFGDFRFNDCSEEEFKEWAMEQFDAEFKDIIKLSCEYRYNDSPECPYPPTPDDRKYDAVAPQWFSEGGGKCWWHENICEGCGSVFVDAHNPTLCGHCRSD